MNDDLNNKIDQIAAILGYNNIPGNLKEAIAKIAGSMNDNPSSSPDFKPESTGAYAFHSNNTESGDRQNEDTVNTTRKIIDAVRTTNDSRMNLLAAIKPLLNKSRQKKISDCIKILQLAKLSSLLENNTDK